MFTNIIIEILGTTISDTQAYIWLWFNILDTDKERTCIWAWRYIFLIGDLFTPSTGWIAKRFSAVIEMWFALHGSSL